MLLTPQDFGRPYPAYEIRGHGTADEGDQDRRADSEEDNGETDLRVYILDVTERTERCQGVCRGLACATMTDQRRRHRTAGEDGQRQPDHSTDHGKGERLAHELEHDPGVAEADRLEDADLALTLTDDHDHAEQDDDHTGDDRADKAVEGDALHAVKRLQCAI